MKKLMIAAAIVCAAAMSQAATASWKTGAANIFDGTGTTGKITGSAYLFDSGITSQSALFALITAPNFDATKAAGYVDTLTVSNGTISNSNADNQFKYGQTSTEDKTNTYKYYFAIIQDDKVYFSNEVSADALQTDATQQVVTFGNQNGTSGPYSKLAPTGSGYAGAGKWSAVAVPEPTSGLLLLLGVAGLALRHRRA